MKASGRTMAQAIADGNWYCIQREGWGEYAPPACDTPVEVLACAKELAHKGHFAPIKAGDVFSVSNIVGGSIGCRWIVTQGTITA